ncbi:MAG TPA: hypothetical protein VFX03_12705, partial [Thermomicrobiales bacterium]|nr:hypothetical protein [Thermomicrobiales bacterium]
IEFARDLVFDDHIGSSVIHLPFSLNRPATIVRRLEAWFAGDVPGGSSKRHPSTRLTHHARDGLAEHPPLFLRPNGRADNEEFIPCRDDLWRDMLQMDMPCHPIESNVFAKMMSRLALVQYRRIDAKRIVGDDCEHLVADGLRIFGRVKVADERNPAPTHVAAQSLERISQKKVVQRDRGQNEIAASLGGEVHVPRFISEKMDSAHRLNLNFELARGQA